MNEVRQLLARNMKRCREILGLTQEKLASRVGCSTTFIANIEIGKRFPSATSFDKIATALEVHPSELFRGNATTFLCFDTAKDIRRAFEEEMRVALDKVESRLEKEASAG
jgi:transcriptional regulator with XRE-family HTH domain